MSERHQPGLQQVKNERDRLITTLRRYILSDGQINKFDGGAIPEGIQVAMTARWLNGAASIEWLLEHPEWYETVDICAVAVTQAEAQRAKDGNTGSSSS